MTAREKAIFFICPFVPYPPSSGIEFRVYQLLRWMKKAGYNVVLIISSDSAGADALEELAKITLAVHWVRPPHWNSPALRTRIGMRFPRLRRVVWESAKRRLRALRGRLFPLRDRVELTPNARPAKNGAVGDTRVKAWFASAKLLRFVGRLARNYRPRAVIVEYIYSTPVFSRFPAETLRIVDTIDVFSRKEDQVLAYGIDDPLACSEEEERQYLLDANLVIAIQSREATLLNALVPEREVILAGVDFEITGESHTVGIEPHRIAVVASDNPLNVHGLQGFLTECWPRIRASCPTATLQVVGRVGYLCHVEDSSIKYSGWVSDLNSVYRAASVVINPTIAGTGLKIKSVEAIAHGKPLVAWSHGVDGLEYRGSAPFIECHSWEEFGDAVVRLLTSDVDRNALSQRALDYSRTEFAADSVYAELNDRLRAVYES